jgi:hypothetical protein
LISNDVARLAIEELPNGLFEVCEYADCGRVTSRQQFLSLTDAFEFGDAVGLAKGALQN